MEEERRVNGLGQNPERKGSDWGHIALLDKTKEFFQTCDVEGKGFITRTDMRVRKRATSFFHTYSSTPRDLLQKIDAYNRQISLSFYCQSISHCHKRSACHKFVEQNVHFFFPKLVLKAKIFSYNHIRA